MCGTHPWSVSKHLHTTCRLRFNASWLSCSKWAADIRPVWFVPLWWWLDERGEAEFQVCVHRLTEAKKVSVFVLLCSSYNIYRVLCLSGSPTHPTFSILLSKLSFAPDKGKIWEQPLQIKILFRKKLRADWSQGMFAIIRCKIFCVPVRYQII